LWSFAPHTTEADSESEEEIEEESEDDPSEVSEQVQFGW
jgi:hypothetical protein